MIAIDPNFQVLIKTAKGLSLQNSEYDQEIPQS